MVGLLLWAGHAFGNLPWISAHLTAVILGIVFLSILPAWPDRLGKGKRKGTNKGKHLSTPTTSIRRSIITLRKTMAYERNHLFGHIGRISLLFTGVLLPLALFGMLAEDVAERENFSFDRPILLFMHAMASPFLDTAMYWITQAGSALVLVPINTLVLAWLIKRRERDTAAFWAISVVGAAVINFAAKNLFTRIRPSMWLSRIAETTYSFPSGHAMSTMAAVTALCVLLWPTRWRWTILCVGGLYVVLVGTSRVYFGVHYPSDILAGWAASLAWVVGVKLLLDHRQRRYGSRGATSPKAA